MESCVALSLSFVAAAWIVLGLGPRSALHELRQPVVARVTTKNKRRKAAFLLCVPNDRFLSYSAAIWQQALSKEPMERGDGR